MKYAIMSDAHANPQALKTALADARARRLEYLPIAFVLQLVFWFLEMLAEAGCDTLLLSVFWTALFAAFVIESIRRLHDCGMSGWMVLTFIIPLFWLVTWMRGTKGHLRLNVREFAW